jgi:hypothetical protein
MTATRPSHVATNKSCPKDDFCWENYQKASRKLTKAQREAFLHGHLRPLLDYALDDPEVRLEIRPGKANLYFEGGTLVRLEGGTTSPFGGVFDEPYNNATRGGEQKPCPTLLTTSSQVEELVAAFPARRQQMRRHEGDGTGRMELRLEQFISRANDAAAEAEFVVVDAEYSYGRCRPDLVLFARAELPQPRLILAELKCDARALCDDAGLGQHAHDFVAPLNAGGGSHLQTMKNELSRLVDQKKELGPVPRNVPFASFSAESPLFLVVFADLRVKGQVCGRIFDRALAELRAEMLAGPSSLDLLRFADFPDVSDRGAGDLLRFRRAAMMTAAQFDDYRTAQA